MAAGNRVLVTGSRPDIRAPFREIRLQDSPDGSSNPPFRRYDTAGPGAAREAVLPMLRDPWIEERGDTELHRGRQVKDRDDGRAALRGAGRYPHHPRESDRARRAKPGRIVTQRHYARQGIVTPEMEFAAIREGVAPEVVMEELATGRAILPANINHVDRVPFSGEDQREHRQLFGCILGSRGGGQARVGDRLRCGHSDGPVNRP